MKDLIMAQATSDSRSLQETMIRRQVIDRGISEPRLLAALRAVPRDRFFPKGSEDDPFADQPASIGYGQTISQPYMVALMTDALAPEPASRVLEVGTGSGYQTAVLAKLAGEVWSVERVKPLLDQAFERVLELGLRNVHFRHGDGTQGWPEAAPFDRVLIAAGAPELPRQLLLTQLADGGVAVLPIGQQDRQMLTKVTRHGDELRTKDLCPCRFVKLIGEEGWEEDAEK
jgi:protein-L-isoaspartate(D-aspartate) O-methyltransferase